MVGKNRAICIAEDIVKRVFDVLNQADKPSGFEDLRLEVSPEIPLTANDLPVIVIDVQQGDKADQSVTQAISNSGRHITCVSIISLNYRADIQQGNNNGIKTIAPLHKWSMRQIMNDKELKAMCLGPVIPAGWGQPYGDSHETAGKGAIQYLEFRHILSLDTAWNDLEQT